MDKLIKLVVQLQDEASAGIGKLNGTLSTMAGVVGGNLIASAIQTAGQAIVGLGASSLTAAGDFEQGLSVLQAVSGATGQQMAAFRDTAMALGNDLTLPAASASDAALAMQELAKAGLDVDSTMAAAKGTLQLAAAAQTDAATAAQVVAGALNAFGLEGDKATMVADQLAAGANASAASMTDLSDGFKQAAFAFDATGQHTDDLITGLAALTNVGLTGSDAGTALKNALLQLMAPTDAAAKAMAEYGINVRDSQGNMLPFADIIGVLQTALGGLDAATREATLKTILQGDGMKAMLPLMDLGRDGFLALRDTVNQAGAAQEVAAAQTTGFNGALGSIKNALETLQLVIGGAVIPVLTMLITTALTPAINAVTDFASALMASGDPFAFLVAQVNAVLPGFAAFVGFVQANLGPVLAFLGTIIAAVVVPALYAWLAAAVATATATIAAFVPVVAPLLAIAAAVALVVAAWRSNFLGIQQIVQPVIDAVVTGFGEGGILGALQGLIGALPAFLAAFGQWLLSVATLITNQVLAWGQAFIAWIGPMIPPALAALGALASSIWAWIVAQAPGFVAQLVAWGQAFIAWIGPAIPQALAAIGGLASSLFAWVAAQAGPLLAQFGAWAASVAAWVPGAITQFLAEWPALLSGFLDWIGGAIGPILAGFGEWAIAIIAWIAAQAPGFVAKLAEWTMAFVSWIAPMIPKAIFALAGLALAIGVFIVETAAVLITKLVQWGAAFLGWVATEVLPKLPGILGNILLAIGEFVSGAVSTVVELVKGIGAGIVDGIKAGVSAAWERFTGWLRDKMSGIPEPIRAALGIHSPSTVMADMVGVPIVEGIAQGIGKASPKAIGAMLDLAEKLVSVVSSGVEAFGKLRNLGAVPMSAITQFADSLQLAMNTFGQMTLTWNKAMMSAASQFTFKSQQVIETMSAGVDFLNGLADLKQVPAQNFAAFAQGISQAMQELIRISTFEMRLGLTAAVEFSTGAGEVIKILGAGVDGLNKLADLGTLPPGRMQQFAQMVVGIVFRMWEVSRLLSGEMVAAAGAFAEGAGKVLSVVGQGVEGLSKLADLAALPPGRMQLFAEMVVGIVFRMWEVSRRLSEDAVAAAAAFSEGAGKVVGIVGGAVDAFARLPELVAPTPGQFKILADGLLLAVGMLWFAARQLSVEAVAATAAFAEGAGKVVAVIGAAVDGFAKLPALIAPTPTQFKALGDGLVLAVGMLWFASRLIATEALEATAAFAEGAGKVVGVIGAAVDGFAKLQDMGPVSTAAIAAFAANLRQTVAAIAAVAIQFSETALAHAKAFSDAAGAAVGILKDGVDGFLTVDTFTGVSEAAINRFADGVRLAVAAMARLAAEFGSDAVAAANAFAKAAGESTDFLKKGVEGFNKLQELDGVPQAGLAVFANAVIALINTTIRLNALISNQMLADAIRIANGTDQVIEVVKNALKAFLTLGGATTQLPNFIAGFVQAVATLMRDFQAAVIPPAQNIGLAVAQGIARGITSGTPAIQNAVFAAVNAALLAARQALGIASPSKVFDELIGQQAGAGLAQGMERSIPVVAAAAQTMAAATIAPAQQPLGVAPRPIAAGGGGGNTFNLTIAPGAIVQRNGENQDQLVKRIVAEVRKEFGLKA